MITNVRSASVDKLKRGETQTCGAPAKPEPANAEPELALLCERVHQLLMAHSRVAYDQKQQQELAKITEKILRKYFNQRRTQADFFVFVNMLVDLAYAMMDEPGSHRAREALLPPAFTSAHTPSSSTPTPRPEPEFISAVHPLNH